MFTTVSYTHLFAIFDIFCHWLCDKNLGFYAKGKPLPLLGTTKKIYEFEPVFLKPELIETKLKIAPKIREQVCGTLNSSKHVMLTGADVYKRQTMIIGELITNALIKTIVRAITLTPREHLD